jgi:hypothetical protein
VRAFGLDINLTRQLAMDAPAGSVGVDGDSPFTISSPAASTAHPR